MMMIMMMMMMMMMTMKREFRISGRPTVLVFHVHTAASVKYSNCPALIV